MSVSKTVNSYTSKQLLQKVQQVQAFLDIQQSWHIKNTLNMKYGLWPNETPLSNPKIRYFGIGIKGRYNVDDEGTMSPYIASVKEQDLYHPIPFRCRPLDEDLTDTERKSYRMRVIETINGVKCASYYLKLVEVIDSEVQIFRINKTTQLLEVYELENRHLRPEPVKPTPNNTQASDEDDIIVGARINLHVTADEVYEYIDRQFADRRMAMLSEYGLYIGEDRAVEVAGTQGPIKYTEAICTTLSFKTTTNGTTVENAAWFQDRTILVGDGTVMSLGTLNNVIGSQES